VPDEVELLPGGDGRVDDRDEVLDQKLGAVGSATRGLR